MKGLSILAAVIGVAAMAALVGYFGAGAVMRSLLAVGGLGFAAVCAIHLGLMVVMGFAWWAVMPRSFGTARVVRSRRLRFATFSPGRWRCRK